jgi:hypothetical protein
MHPNSRRVVCASLLIQLFTVRTKSFWAPQAIIMCRWMTYCKRQKVNPNSPPARQLFRLSPSYLPTTAFCSDAMLCSVVRLRHVKRKNGFDTPLETAAILRQPEMIIWRLPYSFVAVIRYRANTFTKHSSYKEHWQRSLSTAALRPR